MKKPLITYLCLALLSAAGNTLYAQNARETAVKFNKANTNALLADYNYPVEIVKLVLKDRLDKEGLRKMKTTNGYMRYAEVLWPSVSSGKIDAYFKVDGKKGKSTVTVLVSKGYDNFIATGSDPAATEGVKAFLNGLNDHIAVYQKEQDIKAQEEVIRQAEKAQKQQAEQQKALLKEKERLEKKIATQNNDQAAKQKELEAERQKLQSAR
jgi:hypothetical protein